MERSKATRAWLARKLGRRRGSSSDNETPKIAREFPHSLEELARVGGVGLLHLPQRVAAAELAIPSCLAATAHYLIEHGLSVPGIFRIPGQTRTVNALHDHFLEQMQVSEAVQLSDIELTIRKPTLPMSIVFNVHDIASTFKKLLSELPGGILGSVEVFEKLQATVQSSADKSNHLTTKAIDAPKVAAALLEIESPHRLELISAVFGLLAYLKQDSSPGPVDTPTKRPGEAMMSSRALGLVFAPLLLANETDGIAVGNDAASDPPMSDFGSPHRAGSVPGTPMSRDELLIVAGFGRTMMCGVVAEKLISSWEAVIQAIQAVTPPGACYLPWPSGPNTGNQGLTSLRSELSLAVSAMEQRRRHSEDIGTLLMNSQNMVREPLDPLGRRSTFDYTIPPIASSRFSLGLTAEFSAYGKLNPSRGTSHPIPTISNEDKSKPAVELVNKSANQESSQSILAVEMSSAIEERELGSAVCQALAVVTNSESVLSRPAAHGASDPEHDLVPERHSSQKVNTFNGQPSPHRSMFKKETPSPKFRLTRKRLREETAIHVRHVAHLAESHHAKRGCDQHRLRKTSSHERLRMAQDTDGNSSPASVKTVVITRNEGRVDGIATPTVRAVAPEAINAFDKSNTPLPGTPPTAKDPPPDDEAELWGGPVSQPDGHSQTASARFSVPQTSRRSRSIRKAVFERNIISIVRTPQGDKTLLKTSPSGMKWKPLPPKPPRSNPISACVPTRSAYPSTGSQTPTESQISAACHAASRTTVGNSAPCKASEPSHPQSQPAEPVPPTNTDGHLEPSFCLHSHRRTATNVGTIYAELERTRRELQACRAREQKLTKDHEALRAKYERRTSGSGSGHGSGSSVDGGKYLARVTKGGGDGRAQSPRVEVGSVDPQNEGEGGAGMTVEEAEKMAAYWRARVDRMKRAERRRSDSKLEELGTLLK